MPTIYRVEMRNGKEVVERKEVPNQYNIDEAVVGCDCVHVKGCGAQVFVVMATDAVRRTVGLVYQEESPDRTEPALTVSVDQVQWLPDAA